MDALTKGADEGRGWLR